MICVKRSRERLIRALKKLKYDTKRTDAAVALAIMLTCERWRWTAKRLYGNLGGVTVRIAE